LFIKIWFIISHNLQSVKGSFLPTWMKS